MVSPVLLTAADHPIDVVENEAEERDWNFNRLDENQIAMGIQGIWCLYSFSLAWVKEKETLLLVSTFEFNSPKKRRR